MRSAAWRRAGAVPADVIVSCAFGSPYEGDIDPAAVVRVIVTSGKVYYDLLSGRTQAGLPGVPILRLEQLYPFPTKALVQELSRFKQAEIVWCQEEPRNMGAWHFIEPYLEWVLNQINAPNKRPRYAGRAAAAAWRL